MKAAIAAWTLVACAPPPEIVGGTEAQRAVVERVLAEVDAEVVPARRPHGVRIAFLPLPDDLGGTTRRHRGRYDIAVAEDAGDLDVEVTLRHELCHVIDLQSPRPAARRSWPAIPEMPSTDTTDDGLRAELFAELCQFGPDGLDLLRTAARACLPDGVAEAADELRDEVFEPTAPPALVDAVAASARWEGTPPLAGLTGDWRGPGGLEMLRRDGRPVVLDLDRGTWDVDAAGDTPNTATHVSSGEEAATEGMWVDHVFELPSGPRVRIRKADLAWGEDILLFAASDAEDEPFAAHCVAGKVSGFTTSERAVVAASTPDTVRWLDVTALVDERHGSAWRAPAAGKP